MFHKASLRLTGLYLAIMMCLSISFSVGLYHVSVQEVERGLERQIATFRSPRLQLTTETVQTILLARNEELAEARRRIVARLVFTNVLILVAAGVLSYVLARMTLRPIEELHEAQARFTADASHELRTPIASIRTENEVALRDPNLKLGEARDLLQSNIDELSHLTTLTEGLLQLARLEAHNMQRNRVGLLDVVSAAQQRVTTRAADKKIVFTISVAEKTKVYGDSALLEELFMILFDNAIKYSPPKSEVFVASRRRQGKIIVSVRDTGTGIPAEDLPRIFDRFYRADTSRTKGDIRGYGLGLAIAKQIVEAHRGEISAKSPNKDGTTLIVSLPATLHPGVT